MSTSRYNESKLKSVEHLLGYFDQQVLASYRNEPHKYRIESDYFEGKLTVTNEYYRELQSTGKTHEAVSIRFGYRTLHDGNLAIVVWLPDLFEKSKTHASKWSAFSLRNPEWITDYDERFGNWILRCLEGNWDLDNGPLYYLGQTIKIINGLTAELVGIPLFKHEINETLSYPAAENTHRYQDSHKELYGYLIDGIDKHCISYLADKIDRSINIGDKKTIQSIVKLFPDLGTSGDFMCAMNLVSEQRRQVSHGVRSPAKPFPAFSQYTKDLYLCLNAIKELLAMLEHAFGVNGEEAYNRQKAKKRLPQIDRPPKAHYSIVQASHMKGKTIEKVEFGFRRTIEGVHESEALIIYFIDGSIMSLEAGSNVGNLVNDESGLCPENFHVDFIVHWVPEFPKGMIKP
ncbi:MAG: hypothetical protein JW715_02525 [Sedimentisphaerales bacterium]|nr:hypothetical protein [Sedimentisphaerales bacterium]